MTAKVSPEEIENTRKRHLIFSFAVLGCIFLGAFGLISLLDSRYLLGLVLFLFMSLGVLIAVRALKVTNVQPLAIFLSAVLCCLSVFLLVHGGNQGTGVYWSYPVSMLMVLLVGPRVGLCFMGVFLSFGGLFLLGSFDFVYEYSYVQRTRILAAALAQFMLVVASEWIRYGSYSAITKTSDAHQSFANTDSLTLALNRHGLQQALNSRPVDVDAMLILLDVDNFKSINDNYGHDVGDKVLKVLATIIQANTKGGDLVARWGGEEFLVILFGAKVGEAKTLAGKIKEQFNQYNFRPIDSARLTSFSAGVAPLQKISEFSTSLKAADELLYRAKDLGRNRIITAQDLDATGT